ncbi:DUF4386 domain-containing protein [Flagellimonas algicola]|uniref:DUF4386 domain-containing protein n=1 Tax=Flagellimonas algicola TaxID=2583815 RepID=A0ABY2WQV7_9FLAO|nr:DUF4386 domain-containing protein [Allomuricauda algicola]TMU57115.1 DUF4386 domain-containing protein [Allomuricauda algicola]
MTTTTTTKLTFTLGKAALIAGLGLLLMTLTVPFAEFYIFPKLILDDAATTAENISKEKLLFTTSIFLHLITLLCDIVVAWALYLFLKPVQRYFSLLVAWFRLIYTAMYLVALTNLVKILTLVHQYTSGTGTEVAQNMQFYVDAFRLEWSFGLVIFGVYLVLLGLLVFKATYVPKIFGLLLLIAGLGYVIHTLGAFVSPETNLDLLFFTFFGELVFMFWLLIKGRTLKEPVPA